MGFSLRFGSFLPDLALENKLDTVYQYFFQGLPSKNETAHDSFLVIQP